MSSDALDTEVDMAAIVDLGFQGDVGIASSAELLAFADAVERRSDEIDATRSRLEAAVGSDGVLEAAATIAIFNGLVRVADGTGIQLDAGLQAYSADDRATLGIDRFAGAANTTAAPHDRPVTAIHEMFG